MRVRVKFMMLVDRVVDVHVHVHVHSSSQVYVSGPRHCERLRIEKTDIGEGQSYL